MHCLDFEQFCGLSYFVQFDGLYAEDLNIVLIDNVRSEPFVGLSRFLTSDGLYRCLSLSKCPFLGSGLSS